MFSGLKGIDSVSKSSYLDTMIEKLWGKSSSVEVDDFIMIDLASHYERPLKQKIELIKNAMKTKRRISFMYYYQKGEGMRHIEPYRLIEEYGVDCYSVADDGRLLFEQDFASYENMREWLFSFGDKVTVSEPLRLREDRRKQAENILKDESCQNT